MIYVWGLEKDILLVVMDRSFISLLLTIAMSNAYLNEFEDDIDTVLASHLKNSLANRILLLVSS